MVALSTGKLPPTLLRELIESLPTGDNQLLLGPAIGEDAAVIEMTPGRLLVAKSDPITFATADIGTYAVHVCANDLAVTGAVPRFYLPTILLPAGATEPPHVRAIGTRIASACRALGIVVAGGHTEITETVRQPVIAGTMLGEVTPERFVRSDGCQPGELIVLAGSVPIEGTSILARERQEMLLRRGWTAERIAEAAGYLQKPGISVLPPALAAAEARLVSAMHDPTEGGIVTALRELAAAAGVGMRIDLDAIPIPPVSAELCSLFGLDPLGTIASGALLATAAPEKVSDLFARWRALDVQGTIIGEVLHPDAGLIATRQGQDAEFPHFDVDEIGKLWE